MSHNQPFVAPLSRREALARLAAGVGGIGLSAVQGSSARGAAASTPEPHHTPRAKSLIFLNMQGGPTQFETFDYKPELDKYAGKEIPKELSIRFPGKILPSLCKFHRHGQSGLEISDLLPHTGSVADESSLERAIVPV